MRLSHVLTFLAGSAAVALIMLASDTGRELGPQTRAVAPRSSDPRVDQLVARFDQLEDLVRATARPDATDELAPRLDRLEMLLVDIQARAPIAMTPEPSVGVPTATLRLRAKGLSTDLTKAADAIEAWRNVAKRAQDPEAKAEAWFEQGEVYRKLDDYSAAAASWQKVVATVGLESKRGQTAAYQLGWAQAYMQDSKTAYRTFRELAATPGLSKAMDSAVRLQVAGFAKATGDIDTARREYQRYIKDFANDEAEHFRNLAKTAAEQLRKIQ